MIKRTPVGPHSFSYKKERAPASTIFFHVLSSSKDLPVAIVADANGNENKNILDPATPTMLQVNTIYINIGIVPTRQTGTWGDMIICLFVQVADGSGGYFRSP